MEQQLLRSNAQGIGIGAYEKKISKIKKVMIDVCLSVVKQGKGCLLILKQGNLKYSPLMEQDVKPFDITSNRRRLEILSLIDGAVIINEDGYVINYSAKIRSTKLFRNHGTRHSAAYSASLGGNIAILGSEEEKKVRIFSDGKIIMQIDPYEKNIQYHTSEAVGILESIGVGTLGTIGVSAMAPTLGLAMIPGIIVFGSAYHIIKLLYNRK